VPSINTEVNPFKTGNKNPFLNVEKDKEASMTVEDVANSTNQTKIKPKFMYDISGAHTATVNIVRFSPNGMYLASGGDDSAIVIWVQKSRPVEFGSTLEKITWSNHKILRGHLSDIYDISWSPDSKFLISGSVDNSAIIFNMEKGKGIQKMSDHSHFVQGVSWDPRNKYVTTQSSDKSVRIYKNADVKQEVKFYFANQIKRFNKENVAGQGSSNFPPVKENYAEDKMIVDKEPSKNGKKETGIIQYYFADEIQCPSFVRRHNWSPDGSILILVAGILKSENAEIENVVWGFSRKDMTKPCFLLPTLDRSATCIRFCPILFEKDTPEQKGNTNPELIDLPYKMIFAIGTLDSLFIYDTQDICPKYAITNIHYQPITDIAWKGSSILAASSSDGYITFCTFEKDELGRPADPNKLPEKCRESYMNYLNIDSSKNVIPIHNGKLNKILLNFIKNFIKCF
jgi:chromatin assembly factor 1 subunit B